MKTILIMALMLATIAPVARAADPVTITLDGRSQQVLILKCDTAGALVATLTGERRVTASEMPPGMLARLLAGLPATPPPRVPEAAQSDSYAVTMAELAARERERRAAERAAAAQRQLAEEARAIREEMEDIRTWIILEEARKRGINIAIYR